MQHARRGEDISRQIANDARVSESVLMTNYVKETDEEARQRSNRTYHRILASLSCEWPLGRYIHNARSEMESQLRAAIDAKDWARAAEISKRLAQAPRMLPDRRPSTREMNRGRPLPSGLPLSVSCLGCGR